MKWKKTIPQKKKESVEAEKKRSSKKNQPLLGERTPSFSCREGGTVPSEKKKTKKFGFALKKNTEGERRVRKTFMGGTGKGNGQSIKRTAERNQ